MSFPCGNHGHSRGSGSGHQGDHEFYLGADDGHGGSGTPKDVRMFPDQNSVTFVASAGVATATSSSRSIPIAILERTPSELQLDHNEAMAEYREALMYQRVSGALRGVASSWKVEERGNDHHRDGVRYLVPTKMGHAMSALGAPVRNDGLPLATSAGPGATSETNDMRGTASTADAEKYLREEGIFELDL